MKIGSLFAGVGGFDLAFERAGFETAWMVENDKQCQAVLRHRFPNAEVFGDVREVGGVPIKGRTGTRVCGGHFANTKGGGDKAHGSSECETRCDSETHGGRKRQTLVPVSIICGGFPCQDYSVAGKRGGLAGDRGALWWEMHRIIADLKPTWVVGENVPGLLSSNGGRDFLTIIASLVQLGYGCTWATLDSQYFGVAQRRRRLFIVGHSGGVPRPEILALSEGLFGHPAPSREAGQDVAGSTAPSLSASGRGTARAGESRGQDPLVMAAAGFSKYEERDQATALRAVSYKQSDTDLVLDNHGAYPLVGVETTAEGWELSDGTTWLAAHEAKEAHTLIGTVPRRLTPTECEKLQGFPPGWTQVEYNGKPMADGPRYRMCGNAVTVNVVEWLAQRIAQAEQRRQAP